MEIDNLNYSRVVAVKNKFQTFYHFFRLLLSRLFPGLKNCFASVKTFSRIQDSV